MSKLFIPVDIEKAELISAFNATVLHVLLMGMYFVIYVGTMYIYVTRKPSNHRVVLATITIQFLSSIAYTSFQWYEMKRPFIDTGDRRDMVVSPLYASPEWLVLASDISIYIVLVLADGLLIWRCFFVWSRSLLAILIPSFLLMVEIVLFLVQPVLRAVYNNSAVSPTLAVTFNDVVAAAYFTTFATSLITTTLIAYKIRTWSSETGFSRKLYKHILDIVIQSGAVYSLTTLATAISGVLPGANVINTLPICAQNYLQAIGVYVAGLSATILVARVGLYSADNGYPSTANFSGIQFHTHTNQGDVEERPHNISTNVDKMTFADGEKFASESK